MKMKKKPKPKTSKVVTPGKPLWQTSDKETVRLYQGDVYQVLKALPTGSVHMAVTSPPYWGLRDYGTASWSGGDPNCAHDAGKVEKRTTETVSAAVIGVDGAFQRRVGRAGGDNSFQSGKTCRKCGAKRIDRQLGSEVIPDCLGWARGENCARENWESACHVCRMVVLFHELRRVLRNDGTLWMNYGDTYYGGASDFVAPGNLMGMPWRVALALQADGWILRQDIIWSKSNPAPSSVHNRCTLSHEYVFVFSKREGYFFDQYAIKVPVASTTVSRVKYQLEGSKKDDERRLAIDKTNRINAKTRDASREKLSSPTSLANKKSVWTLAIYGSESSHFATFPPLLIEPMIKAGSSEGGCCSNCGAPQERMLSDGRGGSIGQGTWCQNSQDDPTQLIKGNAKTTSSKGYVPGEHLGWQPTCNCRARVVPCTVLDPFIGSGTSCVVSLGLGRRSWGIDLNESYLREIAIPRIEGELLKVPAMACLNPKQQKRKRVELGESIL